MPNTNALNILIVEDNLSYALELQQLVEELGYQVAGRVDNANDALDIIHTKRVDFALFDIDIKGEKTGIDIGLQIKGLNIPILYLTSFADRAHYEAAKSTRMAAYLNKPISKYSLQSTIGLIIGSLVNHNDHEFDDKNEEDGFVLKDFMFFKKRGIYHKVLKKEILIVESNGDFINVYIKKNIKFVARFSISKMEELLPHNNYLRVHRSYLIQLRAIEETNLKAGNLKIANKKIPVSRSNRKTLKERLNNLHN